MSIGVVTELPRSLIKEMVAIFQGFYFLRKKKFFNFGCF